MQYWEIWLENKNKLEEDFNKHLEKGSIKKEEQTKELIQGHLEKANHNLEFTKTILNLKRYNDWAIVSSYYSIYQAALALISLKGYSTKGHTSTLLTLIKYFYKKSLNKEEIKMIDNTALEKEEVLYYLEAKNKRRNASYSTQIFFEKQETEKLRLKAIAFINKTKEIIENEI